MAVSKRRSVRETEEIQERPQRSKSLLEQSPDLRTVAVRKLCGVLRTHRVEVRGPSNTKNCRRSPASEIQGGP
jgi:hypothetical protein